jgi:colicin import membrane protein
MGSIQFGASSSMIARWLNEVKAVDVDGLEEFKGQAAAALLETIRTLEAAHAKALADEAAAAELEQLREQQRIQREKDADAKRIKDAEDAAAEVARKAQEKADAAALLVIEEAEQRAADAEARAAAAEARAAAAEAEDVVDLLQSEALLAIKPADVPVAPAIEISDKAVAGISAVVRGPARLMHTHEAFLPAQEEAVFFAAKQQARATSDLLRLRDEIAERMKPLGRIGVADALVADALHPAITVDWSKV